MGTEDLLDIAQYGDGKGGNRMYGWRKPGGMVEGIMRMKNKADVAKRAAESSEAGGNKMGDGWKAYQYPPGFTQADPKGESPLAGNALGIGKPGAAPEDQTYMKGKAVQTLMGDHGDFSFNRPDLMDNYGHNQARPLATRALLGM